MRVYLDSGNHHAKPPRSTQKESIFAAENKTEEPVCAVGGGTETHQTHLKGGPPCIHEAGDNCHTPSAGLDPASDGC